MRLNSLNTKSLGCYRCGHIWTWKEPPKKPKQCPVCLSRKWDKYEFQDNHQYLNLFGHKFVITHKIPMGRRTRVRYTLELTTPKEEDWIQMYDLHYKCIKCGEAWIGLTDEDDDKEKVTIELQRDSVECTELEN
jgi:uncharacterized Zn finger protein